MDHKALEYLFNAKANPSLRLERWITKIQDLNFSVVYKPGKLQIADCFSRLVSGEQVVTDNKWDNFETYILHVVETSLANALSVETLEAESKKDKTDLA